MVAFLLILLSIVVLVILIDWIPMFNTWQSRIKMGQFTGFEDWKHKIVTTASNWLNRTPTIKVTDNTRVIIIDVFRGNYKRNSIQSWQQGALLLGLSQYILQSNDDKIKKQITAFVNSKLDANGNWKVQPKEIDEVLFTYAISKTPNFDFQKNKPALDTTYNLIQNTVGDDGTVKYRKDFSNYRLVDTIGFVSPFLVRYGILNDTNDAVQLGLKQIREFNKYGMQDSAFIPCHSYDVNSKLPVGLFGWGRGLGWYAIGLMDSWLELPNEHPDKNELTQMIIQLAKVAIQFQKPNGSWSWIIMSPEKQSDSSATAILSWFLANAASISEMAIECNQSKDKAVHYLQQVTRRSGAIDFSQGDTKGIGVYSQQFDILPFTQGFCLRTIYN